MIGLDTNVLVRLATNDDPAQALRAKRWLREHTEDVGFINRVVTVEFVWVLEAVYRYTREQIADALDGLLSTRAFLVEDAAEVRAATQAYRSGSDFADALIALTNHERECRTTLTFDKRAAKTAEYFSLV